MFDHAADLARRDVATASGDEAFEFLTIHLDLFDDTVAEFSGALNGIISRLASGFLTDYIGGVRAALPGSVLLCELPFCKLPLLRLGSNEQAGEASQPVDAALATDRHSGAGQPSSGQSEPDIFWD